MSERSRIGVGAARAHAVSLTLPGRYPRGGGSSEGETAGVGSAYSITLVERENKSNRRNQGPERGDSMMGASTIPVVTMADRHTGKITG